MYYLFLFLISFTRGIANVFSLIILYNNNYLFSDIILFLFLVYFFGIIVSYISLKCSYKVILFISSILYGICYIYLNYMDNNYLSLIFFSLLYSFSFNSFHVIRHLFALYDNGIKKTRNIVFFMYFGNIIASVIGIILISKLSFYVVSLLILLMSIISLFPVILIENKKISKVDSYEVVSIGKNKLIFSILEQFKVIFMELQPLFLYLYIDNSIWYVGFFNIINNIASLLIVYFIILKIKINNFKYYAFILGIILFLKIVIDNNIFLFFIAFFEGIFVKIYDNVSLRNLYDMDYKSVREYLFKEELIFFTSKCIIVLLFLILHINFKLIMFICIIGIIFSGFFIKDME